MERSSRRLSKRRRGARRKPPLGLVGTFEAVTVALFAITPSIPTRGNVRGGTGGGTIMAAWAEPSRRSVTPAICIQSYQLATSLGILDGTVVNITYKKCFSFVPKTFCCELWHGVQIHQHRLCHSAGETACAFLTMLCVETRDCLLKLHTNLQYSTSY